MRASHFGGAPFFVALAHDGKQERRTGFPTRFRRGQKCPRSCGCPTLWLRGVLAPESSAITDRGTRLTIFNQRLVEERE